MSFCPSCGNNVELEWSYCMQCGTDLSNIGDASSDKSGTAATDDEKDSQKIISDITKQEFKETIRNISPYKFEEIVGDIWDLHNHQVQVSQKAQDRGIDIVAHQGNRKKLIQVKRYAVDNTVGSNEVRKYATLYQQEKDVDLVVIVTASTFTSQAERLANDLQVKTVDSDDLYNMLQERNSEKNNITIPDKETNNEKFSSPEEFMEIYTEFIEVNNKLATSVFQPSSRAAEHDGAEALFAKHGGREQLRFAVEMRNEWVNIINELDNIISEMETFPDRLTHARFSQLISEQVKSMNDLSGAYKKGVMYKDKLINARLNGQPIEPGKITEIDTPDREILDEPSQDVDKIKQEQDTCMAIAAKETDKIGDLSDERTRLIESINERI